MATHPKQHAHAPRGQCAEENLDALDALRASGRLRHALVLAQCDDAFQLIGVGLDVDSAGTILKQGFIALGQHIKARERPAR